MFEIAQKYKVETDIPVISSNYKILHFDEFPILFTGTNIYGNKIVGSLAYEDDAYGQFRYFHIIVTDENYTKFLKQKISYRQLIENSNKVFILDKDINENLIAEYHVAVEMIPDDYLPLSNTYCPKTEAHEAETTFSGIIEMKMHEMKIMETELANKLHVTKAKLSLIMKGKQKPDVSFLKAVHLELQIDANILLEAV